MALLVVATAIIVLALGGRWSGVGFWWPVAWSLAAASRGDLPVSAWWFVGVVVLAFFHAFSWWYFSSLIAGCLAVYFVGRFWLDRESFNLSVIVAVVAWSLAAAFGGHTDTVLTAGGIGLAVAIDASYLWWKSRHGLG